MRYLAMLLPLLAGCATVPAEGCVQYRVIVCHQDSPIWGKPLFLTDEEWLDMYGFIPRNDDD